MENIQNMKYALPFALNLNQYCVCAQRLYTELHTILLADTAQLYAPI